MTIFNLGSINIDNLYRVDHLPQTGETLAASDHDVGLGGKGANQSVAAARAGSDVVHIGAVGAEGVWCRDALAGAHIDVTHVKTAPTATGHANICIAPDGENLIVLFRGANGGITRDQIDKALALAGAKDTLILQNETILNDYAARCARRKGVFVIYSAAPFDVVQTRKILPDIDLLVVNQIEADQLCAALDLSPKGLPVPAVLITQGSAGALWYDNKTGRIIRMPAFAVQPVDTTGAGDCFIGYVSAGLDQGLCPTEAMRLGAAASAIQVTRHGTADVMPTRTEVDRFLKQRASYWGSASNP